MNKKDLLPIILLVLAIPLWLLIDRIYLAPKFADKTPVSVEQNTTNTVADATVAASATNATSAAPKMAVPEVAEPEAEEVVGLLKNDRIEIELTSIGGGIRSATMIAANDDGTSLYPELNEDNSPPVVLSFTNVAALTYQNVAGLEGNRSFSLEVADDARSAVFTRKLPNGIFERTIMLGDGYLLEIKDRFIASDSAPCTLPAFRILGVDSYAIDGGINYWGRKLNKLFKDAGKPDALDAVPEEMQGKIVDWVAAKNKFFTQILSLKEPIATMAVLVNRDPSVKGILPQEIAAVLAFQPTVIEAGNELTMDYTYYIGPKQYSTLKAAGNNMEGVMEFETIGAFSWMNWLMEPARKALLWSLNVLHNAFHNYGVAIILLTLIIRILFWPLTHKSTESMRRMQELQPQIKAIQEKYKKDPQRMQQETMKFYKENKVNPMGGCLPMFVQIPVFIALYTVLRNAIELRYAGFLWISDLSAPENLLMGKVPFVSALNILPIVMSLSMIWQQKMTSPSTAATPEQQQQQKMMMFMMPIMMLFFFYSMPSGLVLYWTTSNLLMIAQTGIRNLRKKMKEA